MFVDEMARLRAEDLERERRRSARVRALLRERPAPTRLLRGLPALLRPHPGVPRP